MRKMSCPETARISFERWPHMWHSSYTCWLLVPHLSYPRLPNGRISATSTDPKSGISAAGPDPTLGISAAGPDPTLGISAAGPDPGHRILVRKLSPFAISWSPPPLRPFLVSGTLCRHNANCSGNDSM